MALVAYDNSDSSEYEDQEDIVIPSNSNKDQDKNQYSEITINQDNNGITQNVTNDNIFKFLPPTKHNNIVIKEDDDEFLQKKPVVAKQKAKISVPSLSDFKDVEDNVPNYKPRQTSGKKSGLLSMLPEPKNMMKISKAFIPNVLTQKSNTATAKKKLSVAPVLQLKKSAETKPSKSLPLECSDDDSDDDEGTDFFSINKPHHDIPIVDVPFELETFDSSVSMDKKESKIESYFKEEAPVHMETDEPHQSGVGHQEGAGYCGEGNNSNTANGTLDDEAIRQLCGTRGRRKKEDIQIVDVNQDQVLAGAREMLMKGLMDDTTKRVSCKRKSDGPTSQQRRKHQITYLAHQAKANEAELQNQWANSRMSKRQTQSKYGF